MFKSAASKVMGVGRATVFLVGLAVILALVLGVASTVSAHTGNKGFFHLGHKNVSKAVSTLVNQGPGPALNLMVQAGQPPMKVNSSGKVANLNADQLDGKSSEMFADGVNGKATNASSADDAVNLGGVSASGYQKRVSGQCAAGSSISSIGADGTTVTCEQDDDTGAERVNQLKSDLGTNDGTPNQSSDLVSFSKVKDIPTSIINRDANTLDGKDSTQFANSTHAHSGADITSGTVAESRIDAAIARDSEVVRGPGATYSNSVWLASGSSDWMLTVPGVGRFFAECHNYSTTPSRLYFDSAAGFGGSWVWVDDGGTNPSTMFVESPTTNWEIAGMSLANPDRVVFDFNTPRMTVSVDQLQGIGGTSNCLFTARAQVFQ